MGRTVGTDNLGRNQISTHSTTTSAKTRSTISPRDLATVFVGLDVHKESVAVVVAEPGRATPWFIGTTRSVLAEVEKALSHVGAPSELLIVHEAGPCGYVLTRHKFEPMATLKRLDSSPYLT